MICGTHNWCLLSPISWVAYDYMFHFLLSEFGIEGDNSGSIFFSRMWQHIIHKLTTFKVVEVKQHKIKKRLFENKSHMAHVHWWTLSLWVESTLMWCVSFIKLFWIFFKSCHNKYYGAREQNASWALEVIKVILKA